MLEKRQPAQDRQLCTHSSTNPGGMASWEVSGWKSAKNMSKYTSHWSWLGTLLSQQDCCLAKASLLCSTTAEMTVQWSYCTHEGSTFGYVIFGQMAPCDLQSCNFNHWPNIWSHWTIKDVEKVPDSLEEDWHILSFLMPEDRVLWTMFLAEDSTALKMKLLLFR